MIFPTILRRRFAKAALALGFAGSVIILAPRPAQAATLALKWLSPTSSSNVRVGRRLLGTKAAPAQIETGAASVYCLGTVTAQGGTKLSCQIPAADTAYQYVVCTRDAAGENLGGFECTFQGNGGGWECSPADIAASWCD